MKPFYLFFPDLIIKNFKLYGGLKKHDPAETGAQNGIGEIL
jgi:hypothetical protein